MDPGQCADLPCWPQGEETLRGLLRQTLEALAAVHAANVTHRDVKPENLLVRPWSHTDRITIGVFLLN